MLRRQFLSLNLGSPRSDIRRVNNFICCNLGKELLLCLKRSKFPLRFWALFTENNEKETRQLNFKCLMLDTPNE